MELIARLPEDCTLEDIQYHLRVCQKVDRGLQASDDGRGQSQEDVRERFEEWLGGGRNPVGAR